MYRFYSMACFVLLALLNGFGGLAASADESKTKKSETRAVKKVLADFHVAASKTNAAAYFGQTDKELVFLGTDATERFTQASLRAFAKPYFQKGIGWTYVPQAQHIVLADNNQLAWFDEQLKNEKYGIMRGSGILRRTKNKWKIVQYNLTFQVPNELAPEITKKIITATKVNTSVAFPPVPAKPDPAPAATAKAVLMDYQRAASEAQGERLFSYLARDAVLLGTDPKERWTVDELRKWVKPYFEMGQGWTTVPIEQHVSIAKGGKWAWFDQRLVSTRWGELRSSGVLKQHKGQWKIVHYNTGFPIPNSMAKEVVKQIQGAN